MTRPVAPGLVLVLLLVAAAVPALGTPATAVGPATGATDGPAAGTGGDPGAWSDAAAVSDSPGDAGGQDAAAGPTEARASRPRGIDGSLQDQEFDRTEFHVTVYANGSARWLFVYRKNLANQTEEEQFRTFAEEFNTNETELYRNFRNRATDLASQGTDATGREMEARDFSRSASVSELGGTQGVVEMSFLWTNFAQTSDGGVLVSDVFEGGLYLGENQAMYFHRGSDLRFREDVRPPPDTNESTALTDSQWIRYQGEQQFNPGQPRVPLTSSDATETDGLPGDGADPPTPSGGFGVLPWAALALLVLLGLAAGVAYRSGALSGSGGDGAAGAATADDGGGGGAGTAATEPAVPDEELLSDEDRVMQLLDEHGGRMKQVNIVEETGWSKSKVSMLLSDMEAEDQISKLRVGRENIISLKGEEPDAAGSPFEDGE